MVLLLNTWCWLIQSLFIYDYYLTFCLSIVWCLMIIDVVLSFRYLLKNPVGNNFVSNNYRCITLSPVISKLFAFVMIRMFEKQLDSGPLQFAFKQNSSCQSCSIFAINRCRSLCETWLYCEYMCLGYFQNFRPGCNNHYALSQLLINKSLPRNFAGILLDWFTECSVCVRWGWCYLFRVLYISWCKARWCIITSFICHLHGYFN